MTDHNGQPAIEPIAVAAEAAGQLFGVSEKTWRRMDTDGLVPQPIRMKGCPRWVVEELRSWGLHGAPHRNRWEAVKQDLCAAGR